MTRATLIVLACLVPTSPVGAAQAKRPAGSAAGTRTEPVQMECSAPLGTGVQTGRVFCDVLTGTDPATGVILRLPKHQGPAIVRFDLHNRQTYSPELERAGRAYTRSEATVGALALDGTLLRRFSVLTEFRRASDLFDRIAGGSGPGGLKAVAPTGVESVMLEVPAAIDAISILGERLVTTTLDGEAEYTTPGRPVALLSNPQVEYRPAARPSRRPARRR